ncbi:hypothetical protein NONO_c62890 [Nocardia nova SH22a]|uniref:Uncharacterized protein n=1 Tax=Nocardia nova SH22a TaxID=1415166 RepID=W5TPI5_9NOCA|nr:hypothetical protein [Nocardia nova]AHH21059.1 hypothetical protein NONO_c62890 [Nocardia nova SH22a]
MQNWQSVEEALHHRSVTDVLVPGLIDRDPGSVPVFRPHPTVVHVVLDTGALRLESAFHSNQLTVTSTDSVSLGGVEFFERAAAEADDEIAQMSWGEQLFGDGWSQLRCTAIRPYSGGGADLAKGVLQGLALELESRYWLFFDPGWTFGIRIGNAEDMRRWES